MSKDMADPENKDTDNFVELDGVKYKEDPENKGQALMGDDSKLVLYKEEEEDEKKKEETSEEKEKREKKEDEEDEEGDPPVRKSAKDFIIERKQKKIDKLEKKENKESEADEGEGDGAEEVTPAGEKAINRAVQKELKPVLQTIRTNADEQELANVLAKYPDAKKVEKQIRKYMDNDSFKAVSVEFIFLGLAAKKIELQKKRDEADESAKADTTGGHGKKKKETGPVPDVRGWNDKQIGELVHKVQTGQV